ncbi:MAG TPA: hypothetical protein VGL95_00890 [Acetobacteraceae bacterium]|jgi:hypothetical protein
MRIVALAILFPLLAACSGGPQALGITGPQGSVPTPVAEPAPPVDPLENPATLSSGTRYGPTYAPSTGGGNFWGYN